MNVCCIYASAIHVRMSLHHFAKNNFKISPLCIASYKSTISKRKINKRITHSKWTLNVQSVTLDVNALNNVCYRRHATTGRTVFVLFQNRIIFPHNSKSHHVKLLLVITPNIWELLDSGILTLRISITAPRSHPCVVCSLFQQAPKSMNTNYAIRFGETDNSQELTDGETC